MNRRERHVKKKQEVLYMLATGFQQSAVAVNSMRLIAVRFKKEERERKRFIAKNNGIFPGKCWLNTTLKKRVNEKVL